MNISILGGYSIVEISVTIAILLIGFISLNSLQTKQHFSFNESKQILEATNLAELKLKELRNFLMADNPQSPQATVRLGDGTDTVNGINAKYTRKWTITPANPTHTSKVNMTVTWVNDKGVFSTITLVSDMKSISVNMQKTSANQTKTLVH